MNLKSKTISGVLWNAFELFGGKGVQIVITIILARLLAPEDFGVIGLLIIFTEFSKVILDSGFSQALIRKQDVNYRDLSSVFYFNIAAGIILYCILYFSAPLISNFYNFPALTSISRAVFLTLIFNSFGIVQNARIVQQVNFRILAKRTIIANLCAGFIAVFLAYQHFGVWALVWQMVIASFLRVILLWHASKWLPSLFFSLKPIKRLFRFSGNLLLSGLFDVIATNIQTLLIGKFYTKTDLGFYTQARQLSGLPSQTLTTIVRNVTYPTLSVIQSDNQKLKFAYKKIIRTAILVVFPVMIGLTAVADNLIPLILGPQWIPAIPYFKILCLVGAIFPLYSVNQNIFLVKGNSKLFLKVSIIKRIISLLFIFLTINFSVLALVIGHLLATTINTVITMFYSGKEIEYSMREQLKDIGGIMMTAVVMATAVYLLQLPFDFNQTWILLLAQTVAGLLLFLSLAYTLKLSVISDVKEIFHSLSKKI